VKKELILKQLFLFCFVIVIAGKAPAQVRTAPAQAQQAENGQELPGTQEHVAPLNYNPLVQKSTNKQTALQKTTALNLPFFEDFTGYTASPDNSKWVENEVYVNNTMCVSPISRGVATFDALNQYGIPYNTVDNLIMSYADSLTSQPIDLSGYSASDSLYLSFFYQPQGNGFFPQPGDSLMVYMRTDYSDWLRVWMVPGTPLQPFVQAMIPITDSIYFYSAFQFRFVNIAALNYSDAVWNVDYVRMDVNRNINDTAVNDVAFTADPTFLLNDYTYMPYRQFLANPDGERASQYTDSIRNNYGISQPVNYGFTARETVSKTPLYTANINGTNIPPSQIQQLSYAPAYTATVPIQGTYDVVNFENKYFIDSISASDSRPNDTIVREQTFDNYLAYDDGTAEQSYYLTLSASLPATMAIEYHLNQPDTLRAISIYFGRTAPLSSYKFFNILVYTSLAGIEGADTDRQIHEEDFLSPAFGTAVNGFYTYALDTPIALPAGTFYVGLMQPAYSGSDSLYYGLDVNRIGTNHVFYNTEDQWNASQLMGAVMVRPVLGQPVFTTSVPNVAYKSPQWSATPNPAKDDLHFNFADDNAHVVFQITDIQGRSIMSGNVNNGTDVNISKLVPGMYFVNLSFDGMVGIPQKIVKQ
jgi:hypothetical protein